METWKKTLREFPSIWWSCGTLTYICHVMLTSYGAGIYYGKKTLMAPFFKWYLYFTHLQKKKKYKHTTL